MVQQVLLGLPARLALQVPPGLVSLALQVLQDLQVIQAQQVPLAFQELQAFQGLQAFQVKALLVQQGLQAFQAIRGVLRVLQELQVNQVRQGPLDLEDILAPLVLGQLVQLGRKGFKVVQGAPQERQDPLVALVFKVTQDPLVLPDQLEPLAQEPLGPLEFRARLGKSVQQVLQVLLGQLEVLGVQLV